MNRDILEEILQCPTVPSLPQVALRVIELTQDADVSLDELARVIQNDQGLSAKILRTVNSSLYALRTPCSTISQALVMLGLSAVKSLALGFSLVSSCQGGEDDLFDYAEYWRRGLYTAVAAKRIAADAGRAYEDEAFFGGLLQDVGMIAMHQALGDRYLRALARADGDHRKLVRFELLELEVQHPEVGALLAKRWKLPDQLVIPVKYHERPTAAPAEHADLARCVGLANLAYDILTLPQPAATVRRFHVLAENWFGMGADACEALLHRIAQDTKQVSGLFQVDTGPQADAGQILREAETQLSTLDATRPPAAEDAPLRALLLDAEDTDPLTGVLNRASFLSRADEALVAARRAAGALAILTVQIDGLSSIVASRGTEAADAVLAETAGLLGEHVEAAGSLVGRWDRGLFAICLPCSDGAAAVRLAGTLRAAIEAASRGWRAERTGPAIPVSASVGVAVAEGEAAALFTRGPQLIAAAVRAAEAASAAGGNCVRSFIPRAKAA